MTDDDDADPVDAEIRARVVAEMSGVKVAPLTAERIAAHEQRLAERRAQDELERAYAQWASEQERAERERLEAEAHRNAERARQNDERRATLERQREAADRRSVALAASDAATSARETRRRLAQIEAAELRTRHLAAMQQTLTNLSAAFAQPVPEEPEIIEVENTLHPSFARRRWGID
jgi:hypothetical protein